MNDLDIKSKILDDDDFVLSETKKLQYLYGLQKVIRNHLKREEAIETESVAEHVHAMSVLAHYFGPLEHEKITLDYARVHSLITWHDIDEIETGDIIGYLKTDEDRLREASATHTVLQKSPDLITSLIQSHLDEYKAQTTPESRFVKALDKLDPVFYLFNKNGYKLFKLHEATKEQHCRIKEPYLKDYKYMYRFYTVITQQLEKEGFFCD